MVNKGTSPDKSEYVIILGGLATAFAAGRISNSNQLEVIALEQAKIVETAVSSLSAHRSHPKAFNFFNEGNSPSSLYNIYTAP